MKAIKLFVITVLALFSFSLACAQPIHAHKKRARAHHKRAIHHRHKAARYYHKARHAHHSRHKK